MSRFIQLHYLTVYPPSNPNRDDLGRPKSAMFGGAPRLRISSQAIKRAARISEVMQQALEGHLGARTQRIGDLIRETLLAEGADEMQATDLAKQLADVFGKPDAEAEKKGHIRIRQLAFVSPEERALALEMARKALMGEKLPDTKELKKLVLRRADGAADVAMFGRMLADDPDYNREAAVQVSHALTTHRALVEDDFYTAVDDLKTAAEDAGAGFVGDAGYGSGVYYLYACVDTDLLVENLAGDRDLAARAVEALAEALAVSTPSGKRNSFAHQTRAGFVLAESGCQQPRSLAGAFFRPVEGDLLAGSVAALREMCDQMDRIYGACAEGRYTMDVVRGDGTLAGLREFVRGVLADG
ncbi:type I-E CRISPR-associated protein Cas7/Cse4/CasC [Palleronia caenipelagi]|uniref:Type I-E CRISPR-associated protein Cas7/Cse4/CasC n=1 Tax=Palleronia caenipelagi TaxID=2489174 RepID=A0A547PMK9_9RHOB|nr:type I-E CRISPR-associated protein Cas7/Cse4/CasC [Palleronia caenipelagi]TRD15380.1 type I-E CRISPR-associated protein Cas7/Cse4/CasC [Palleronia caenipelagi]